MQESYGEGVADHTDPELCVASRKAGDEALVGACAGQVLSPESTSIGVPTLSREAEGHTLFIDKRERNGDSTGSETLSMHRSTSHANREIPGLLQRPSRQGAGAQREV
jgi:hypothetical protein